MSVEYSYEYVAFGGNLGGAPELKYTGGGEAFAKFNIAINRRKKDKDGNWGDAPAEWYKCIVWGSDAEWIAELKKGAHFDVHDAEKQTSSWEKDGQTHYSTEFKVKKFYAPDLKKRERSDDNQNRPPHPADAQAPSHSGKPQVNGDDNPF